MTVLDCTLWFELENYASVFIRFALPFTFPNNWTAFLPIRDNCSAKHILLDGFGIHESFPDSGTVSIYDYRSRSDQFLFHGTIPFLYFINLLL